MHTNQKLQTINKILYGIVVLGITFFILGMSSLPAAHAQAIVTTPQPDNPYFKVDTVTLPNGESLEVGIISGPPTPPPGFEIERQAVSLPEPNIAAGTNTLTVPAYNWVFGCSSVSGSMIAAYYDRNGYPNMYTGPTDGGVMPLNNSVWGTWSDGVDTWPNIPLAASHQGVDGRATKGSIDDYWVQYESTASDPYITGGWGQHTWGDAIGDYMKTSQSAYSNTDGSTMFYNYTSNANPLTCATMVSYGIQTSDGTYGRKLFYEARGYTVTDCYSQKTDNTISGGFSYAQYKAEIDAGHPVMLNLEGHTIVGVGYSDPSTVYIHDTWDYSNHTMIWGGSYAGMPLLSVSIVNLQPAPSTPKTISGNAGVGGATLSYTDGTAKTATADSAGNYSFTVSYGWSGTVTPSKTGYYFTPTNRYYPSVTADQTGQNYTATMIRYTISGYAGMSNAKLSYTDGTPKTITADGSGNYSFTVPYGWSGTVLPWTTGYGFTPSSRAYSNVLSNQTSQNYSATTCVTTDAYIAGVLNGSYCLTSGQSTRQAYDANGGPMKITNIGITKVIAAERVNYFVGGTVASYAEMMGLPTSQLSTTYWFPWYKNDSQINTQLRIGNVSGVTAQVHVYIAGVEVTGSPYTLTASGDTQSVRLSYAANGGPVKIVSDQNIVASERVNYFVGSTVTSYSEMMGLPNAQLSTLYWFPWYKNDSTINTQIRIGNVSGSEAHVHVFIGTSEMSGSPFTLTTTGDTQSLRLSFSANDGPVKIQSDQNIVAAERVNYFIGSTVTSYSEMMGLPNAQLSTLYWFPWYKNDSTINTQLRIGIP